MSRAISKDAVVLVTGANGFIASHVADQILRAGYKVRGTARDSTKAGWITKYFDNKYGNGKFECVVVADMDAPGAFDDAMKGCDAVAHVASDMTFRPDPNEVIPPVIAGVKNVLRAAAANSTVKRFVLCSSSTAAVTPTPGVEFTVDSATWNDETVEAAWRPPPYEPERAFLVYGASKTQGERACWEFLKNEKPGFVFNAVLPNFCVGEILVPDQQSGSTSGLVKKMYEGDEGSTDFLRGFPPQYFVSVKDVGRLFFAALTMDDVEGERLLAFSGTFNFNTWIDTMRKISPEKTLPEHLADPKEDLSKVKTERSVEILKKLGRPGFMNLEECVRDCLLAN